MNIVVDRETMRVTTRCEKQFRCLACDREGLCPVADSVDGSLHLVQCCHDKECSYQVLFGPHCLCTCPTRREIHDKYGM